MIFIYHIMIILCFMIIYNIYKNLLLNMLY